MKKFILLFGATILALSSCRKESPVITDMPEEPEAPAKAITYSLDAIHPDGAATKAVKTGWETGDVIFVFFSKSAAPGYLEMKWDGTKWNFTEKNSLAIPDGQGTMYAVYQPFGNDNEVLADNGNWVFKDIHYTYYLEDSQSYTITDGQVSGTFNMGIPDGFVQFFLDDPLADSSTEMELREKFLLPAGVHFVNPTSGIERTRDTQGTPVPGYVYDKENKASGEQKGWLFSGLLDFNVTMGRTADYHFTLVKGGWQGSYYQKSFLNKQYYTGPSERRALKMPALSTWTELTGCKPIDLGTKTANGNIHTYWSSRNLGASKDFPDGNTLQECQATWGDYYAWGATKPYYQDGHAYDNPCSHWKPGMTGYDWLSYPHSRGDFRSIYKYTIADGEDDADWYDAFGKFCGDNLKYLEREDDAAALALGARWRVPSYQDWAVLFDTNNFTISYDQDHRGVKFTSKIPGYEGRSIFLPLAGEREHNQLDGYAVRGYYWSVELSNSDTSTAKAAIVLHSESGYLSDNSRNFGMSVRPISY